MRDQLHMFVTGGDWCDNWQEKPAGAKLHSQANIQINRYKSVYSSAYLNDRLLLCPHVLRLRTRDSGVGEHNIQG